MRTRPPRLLTIAGSDSGGGAGIQADLKTFGALGGYGMSVVVAVTAQNTQEVRSVQTVEPAIVRDQIEAVFEDIGVDALKIGMLANADLVATVADCLEQRPPLPTVVDPVMVSKSGRRLLDDEGVRQLTARLLPRATVLTPNLPEAEILVGRPLPELRDRLEAGRALCAQGASSVLMKGGHADTDPVVDLLFDGERRHLFEHARLTTRSDHGTGCTVSAAITAGLGAGLPLVDAIGRAIEYLQRAMASAFPLGHGRGPVDHFFRLHGVRQ